MTKKQKTLMIVFAVAVIAMAVVQWVILPDAVVLQVDSQGNPGTPLPKIFAVIIPLIAGLAGVYMMKTEADTRAILFSSLGLVIPLITIMMNR